MSFPKISRTLPKKVTRKMVIEIVSKTLHQAHRNDGSAVKRISRQAGVNTHTVGKWLLGLYAPTTAHFLTLLTHYPEMLCALLKVTGNEAAWRVMQLLIKHDHIASGRTNLMANQSIYTPNSVGVNVIVPRQFASKLNARQLWFLGKLQQGAELRSTEIINEWAVNLPVAQRDVRQMVALNLIRFEGAPKNGHYRI